MMGPVEKKRAFKHKGQKRMDANLHARDLLVCNSLGKGCLSTVIKKPVQVHTRLVYGIKALTALSADGSKRVVSVRRTNERTTFHEPRTQRQ